MPTDPFIGRPEYGVEDVTGQGQQPQWYLHRTNVLEAWAVDARGQDVVIADVDWGCLTTHQELVHQLEYVTWMHDGSKDVEHGREARHGTAVLGLAAAAADGAGMCGYAPEAKLWMLRADPPEGVKAGPDPWASAIEHVRTRDDGGRRKVLLLEVETAEAGRSFEQFPGVAAAIREAINSDVVVCVPAGNGGVRADLGDDGRPFKATGSIVVGATAWDLDADEPNPLSNHGQGVVIWAPGDPGFDVTCGNLSNRDYRDGFGGTSGAAAKVAGTVALMLSANPGLTHDEVRGILVHTGRKIVTRAGAAIVMLDAGKAVNEAKALAAGAPQSTERALQPRGAPMPPDSLDEAA